MFILVLSVVLAWTVPTVVQGEEVPKKALCLVCALKGGETEEERVKAHTTHQGKAYYFCSEGCKTEFEADPVGFLPPVLPRPAPPVVFETLNGVDKILADFKGKLVVLDFWATWCKPCVEMMPQMQTLQEAFADQGVVVVGVSIDEGKDRVKKIEKFLTKTDVNYLIFSDAKLTPAWHQFNVKAIPAVFLIDTDGQVVAQWTGKVDHQVIKNEIISRLAAAGK